MRLGEYLDMERTPATEVGGFDRRAGMDADGRAPADSAAA